MSPEDRREAIVQATLPLVVKAGANVTTSQIAAAAGIAEGTVFRVFKDKAELLDACIQRALHSDEEVARMEAIPADVPLEERLTAGVAMISGYLDRMWGRHRRAARVRLSAARRGPQEAQGTADRHAAAVRRRRRPVRVDAKLRVSPELAGRMLLGLVFTNRMQGSGFGEIAAEPAAVVELFLHGALEPGGAND